MAEYYIRYYVNSQTGRRPARDFILSLPNHVRGKVHKYLDYLRVNNGHIDEPYSRHIVGKIRELRVDFSNIRHRIFYFTFIGKQIILLHGFIKKTAKTPVNEINKAVANYNDIITNPQLYGQPETQID